MSIRSATFAWTATGVVLFASASFAQTSAPAKDEPGAKGTPAPMSVPRTKPMRKSVVDLEKMAKERRPGQVMPGDPTPVAQPGVITTIPEATPATPQPTRGAIQLPDTSPAAKPSLRPATDPWAPMNIESMAPTPSTPMAEVSAPTTPAPMSEEAAMPSTPAPAAPMAEVATPAPEIHGSSMRAEPLPHIEAMHARPEPMAATTESADSGSTIGGVGIVDKFIITAMPMALNTGPARVRIESLSGDASGVQWRAGSESWRSPAVGDTVDSRTEIRAGLDAEMVLVVDERVQVRITRLGRAVIERTEEPNGTTAMSITLSRGAAEIRPWGATTSASGEMFARVKTPDQVFGLTGPLRVEYDAFTGTRRRTLNP